MKYKIKRLSFFIFIISILYLGVREINYSNYQIIENGTKEVISIQTNGDSTKIFVFGKNYVLNDKIQNIIKQIKD